MRNKITHNFIAGNLPSSARRSSRAGFSLVEVLVAIALLTIGIVAFFQLFPIGFYNLQVAANTSAADRLAQAELQRLTNGAGAQVQQIAAIEQIYSSGADQGLVQLDPNFDPDAALTLKTNKSAGIINTGFNYTPATATQDEPYAYIGGEVVSISAPETNTTSPCNVMLDFGPFELPTSYSSTALATFNSLDPGQHASLFVHGTPWFGISGSSAFASSGGGSESVYLEDPEVELTLDSPEYLIDYTNGYLAFHEPTGKYPQTVIFQVRDSDTTAGVIEPKTFIFHTDWSGALQSAEPANTLSCWDSTVGKPRWVSLATLTAINQLSAATQSLVLPLQSGTDKLVRDFQLRKVATFDSDPYEFALPSSGLGTDSLPGVLDNSTIYDGRLQFNPLASHIVDNRGRPLQATVDYIVSDWHTIHEDRTTSSQGVTAAGGATTSAIRLTLNHLLRIGSKDQMGNTYTGLGQTSLVGTDVVVYDMDTQTTLAAGTGYTVDYDNGIVTLINQPGGTHVRIYYHPADDWGITAIKPAASYQVVSSTTAPTLTSEASLNGTVLTFPECDHDRLVQVGNVVLQDTTTLIYSTVPIQQLVKLQPAVGSAPGALPSIQLTAAPCNLQIGSTQRIYSVTVSGASLTTRVIWRERDLWRHRDVTTVNLPSSS